MGITKPPKQDTSMLPEVGVQNGATTLSEPLTRDEKTTTNPPPYILGARRGEGREIIDTPSEISLPYWPRKFTLDYLSTLRYDFDYWTGELEELVDTWEPDYYQAEDSTLVETDKHGDTLHDTIPALRIFFQNRPDIYISGNNGVYWEEGNKRAVLCPDIYVVVGAGNHQRDTYKVWEEVRPPHFVVEVSSHTTKEVDLEKKYHIYEQVLKVEEYFLFDPQQKYLDSALIGFRLEGGKYRGLLMNAEKRFVSEQLGLELGVLNGVLRFFDPAKKEWIRTAAEHAQFAQQETMRAEAETKRRIALEAELEQLRSQMEALRLRS